MSTSEPSSPGWWARLQRLFFEEDEPRALLTAPRAHTLENIGGSDENLLHRDQTRQDLRIEFDLWHFSEPAPDAPDKLELFLIAYGSTVIATQQWTAPIAPAERFIMLPKQYLLEGRHELYYRVTLGASGTVDDSEIYPFTVDLSAAEFGSTDGQLQFPAEALDGVTARYLETHDDRLEATVPAYYPMSQGDVLKVYWEQQPLGSLLLYERELNADDIEAPLVLTFSGDQIRAHGDGPRYVTYKIADRSGNQTGLSRTVPLQVDAAPIPRYWPAPKVYDSSGAQLFGMLDPLQALTGVTVRIAADAVFYAGERVRVQWAEPGALGATQVVLSIVGNGPWSASIDKAWIGAHMGKPLNVYYALHDDGSLPPSTVQTLQVGTIPKARFPTVQSRGASLGGGNLSVGQVPDSGDPVSLAPWPLAAARTQLLKLWAVGTGANGSAASLTVIDGVAVTTTQVNSGVSTAVPKAWLDGLQRGRPLRLFVNVSFDTGQTWTEFPELSMTVRD